MGSGRGQQGGGMMQQAAQRRAQAQATKKKLNVEQAARAPVRQNQPPPQVPAEQPPEATPDERMMAMTQQFLQRVKRPGAVPNEQPPARVTAPVSSDQMVTDKIQQRAATEGFSAQQQFYRVAGRMPTPRDLAVFNTAKMLEQQLGRKPTKVELTAALSDPRLLGSQAPTVVGP